MIELKNISFRYNDDILFENYSKRIEAGKKVAIIGESGSGKSTFLNLLAAFEIPQKGNIFYNNIELNIQTITSIRQEIAWLPQDFNVPFDSLRELFFSTFTLKINKPNKPTNLEIVELFSKLGLKTEILEKKINEVSGGQKQRVLLASIILSKKKYIILDEPSSALDEYSTKKLISILQTMTKTTVISATHDRIFIDNADLIINLDKKN